jgi:ATP-dependent Clp protease ATP-binding subunit ClpA
MYERFTDRARQVMQLANQEAQRFNHEYIGTEHILLGLVQEGSGVAANVLKNLDIDLRKVRLEVEKIVQTGPDSEVVPMVKLPKTPRARKVIEYAIEESRNLGHNYVGTEHLLLGLLREREGVASQVLANFGLELQRVRGEALTLLGANEPFGRDDAVRYLRNQRDSLEYLHRVSIAEDALIAAVDLSAHHPSNILQPATAFSVIYQACTEVRRRSPPPPPEVQGYDEEIERLNRQKEEAVAEQDFERAARLRDEAEKIIRQRDAELRKWRRQAPDTVPVVGPEDVAAVVGQMAGEQESDRGESSSR